MTTLYFHPVLPNEINVKLIITRMSFPYYFQIVNVLSHQIIILKYYASIDLSLCITGPICSLSRWHYFPSGLTCPVLLKLNY